MNFRSKYTKIDRIKTNSGCMIKDELAPVLDKHGNKVIKKKGETNLYAYINSWRDECDINILLARYTNGDKTALVQRAGMFADLSSLPTDFNSLLNLTMQAQPVFDSLPTVVKEAFGNNVNNFLSNAGTEPWLELLSKSPDDFRKEIIRHSKQYTLANKELIEKIHKDIEQMPEVKPVEETSPSLADQINTVYGGKLNEQKQ